MDAEDDGMEWEFFHYKKESVLMRWPPGSWSSSIPLCSIYTVTIDPRFALALLPATASNSSRERDKKIKEKGTKQVALLAQTLPINDFSRPPAETTTLHCTVLRN